jgi:hypothetical protein
MKTKSLRRTNTEIAKGEQLLRQETDELRKSRGKVARGNKKRTLKVMKKAVKALEEQKDIIRAGTPIPVAD